MVSSSDFKGTLKQNACFALSKISSIVFRDSFKLSQSISIIQLHKPSSISQDIKRIDSCQTLFSGDGKIFFPMLIKKKSNGDIVNASVCLSCYLLNHRADFNQTLHDFPAW